MKSAAELDRETTNPSASEPMGGRAAATVQPKSALVAKLLRRGKGASLAELQNATAWQPHSVRAFLSGLRKRGQVLIREQRKSGDTAYRIASGKAVTGLADA